MGCSPLKYTQYAKILPIFLQLLRRKRMVIYLPELLLSNFNTKDLPKHLW